MKLHIKHWYAGFDYEYDLEVWAYQISLVDNGSVVAVVSNAGVFEDTLIHDIEHLILGLGYSQAEEDQLSKHFGKPEPGFTHQDWEDRLRGYDINDWLLLFNGQRFNMLRSDVFVEMHGTKAVVSFGKMQHTVLR